MHIYPILNCTRLAKKDLFNYLLKFREINEQLPLGGFIFPVRPAQRQMWELTDWGGRQVEATHTHTELQSCHVLRDIYSSCKDPIRATIYVCKCTCPTCTYMCVCVFNEIEQSQHSARALEKKKLSSNAITDYDFPNNLMQLGRQERRARSALLS